MLSDVSIATKVCQIAGQFEKLAIPIAAGVLALLIVVTLIDRVAKREDRYANYWLLIPHAVIPAGMAFAALTYLGMDKIVSLIQPLTGSTYIFFGAIFGAMVLWLVTLFIGAYIRFFPLSLIFVLVADVALAAAILLGLSVEFVSFTPIA